MPLSDDDKQLAIRVSKVAQKVLDVTPFKKQPLRSTDIFEYLVTEGLFPRPKDDSTPFSRFLRKVKKEGYLSLIPQIEYEDVNPHFTNWYFNSRKPAKKSKKQPVSMPKESFEKFSYFENLMNTNPVKDIDVNEFINMVRLGLFRNEIEELRKTGDKSIKKSKLGAITTSGVFTKRNGESLVTHSGLIQIDFDDVSNLEDVKDNLCKDEFTHVCFVSPRGNGLKLIVKITPSSDSHTNQFLALEEYYKDNYDLNIDPACKDVSRAMLLSYDKDIFWNENSKRFKEEKEVIRKKPIVTNLKNSTHPRHQVEYKNISENVENVVKKIEESKIDITGNYYEWCKLGFSLISHFQEDAKEYFHRISRYYPNYRVGETEKEFDNLIKNFKEGISIKTFFWMAKENGVEL